MSADPATLLESFLDAAARNHEGTARDMASFWDPKKDGAARLFGQLSRRGVEGFVVGKCHEFGDRAVVELRKSRVIHTYFERLDGDWKFVAVRDHEVWATLFAAGRAPAFLELEALDAATPDETAFADDYMNQLIDKKGQVDGAPFNLRLIIMKAERVDSTRVQAVRFGLRFAVEVTVFKPEPEPLWLIFESIQGGWGLHKATTSLAVSDLMALPASVPRLEGEA